MILENLIQNGFSFQIEDKYIYPKPKTFNEAFHQLLTIYFLIDIIKDRIEKETCAAVKEIHETRLKNKFKAAYRNQSIARKCFDAGEVDEYEYLSYLQCFMEIMEMEDEAGRKAQMGIYKGILAELTELERIAHN